MAHENNITMEEKDPVENVHNRLIPEETNIDYSNTYISSSSSDSYTSLDKNDGDLQLEHETREKIQYPADLLGVSWGSYLHSGPPTRAGLSHEQQTDIKTQLKDVKNTENDHSISVVSSHGDTSVHGILRALPVKQTTQQNHSVLPAKSVKLVCESESKDEDSRLLLVKLQGLTKSLLECKAELEKCGLETAPLASLLLSLQKLNPGANIIIHKHDHEQNGKVLSDVIEYLRKITESLTKQGRQLNEQAVFLQKAGKQLGRNHQSLLEEQAILEQAIERAQQQLAQEKQKIETQKNELQEASEHLRTLLGSKWDTRQRSNRMSSPHTIAQGRRQLVALKQTQKEQSRLEKLFLQQQREIRTLQRKQGIIKSDLLVTKEHAERLQHRLEEQLNQMTKSTLLLTSYTYKSRDSRGKIKGKRGMDKLLVSQRSLKQEVDKMRRQITDQQRRERQLIHKQDTSHQLLKETRTKLKWQSAAVRGGYDYQEFKRPGRRVRDKLASERQVAESVLVSPYKLPSVGKTKNSKQKNTLRPIHREPPVILPDIPGSQSSGPNNRESRTIARHKILPSFSFSKTELQSLACFRDEEAAEQVLEWLEMQGKLPDT